MQSQTVQTFIGKSKSKLDAEIDIDPLNNDCATTIVLWSLLSSPQSQHQMQRRLFLDIVVRQSPPILQLLAGKDQPLLLRRDSLLILNLGLHILNGIIRFHIQGNRLASQGLDENLHSTTTQSQHQVQGGLLLDIVIRQSTSILQLLSCENQPLLLRRDTFLVLNLRLHVLDSIIGLDIQSNSL